MNAQKNAARAAGTLIRTLIELVTIERAVQILAISAVFLAGAAFAARDWPGVLIGLGFSAAYSGLRHQVRGERLRRDDFGDFQS